MTKLTRAIESWLNDCPLLHDDPASRRAAENYFLTRIANPNTARAYFAAVRDFATVLTAQEVRAFRDVTPMMVKAYIDTGASLHRSKRRHERSSAHTLSALRCFFAELVAQGAAPTNPCLGLRAPKLKDAPGTTKSLSPDQLAHLLHHIRQKDALGVRDRALIAFLVYTACRIGAALKVTHGAFHEEHGILKVNLQEKGGKAHRVHAGPHLRSLLEPYLALLPSRGPDLPLFRTWNATTKSFTPSPLSYSGAYLAITNRIKAAGLPHHFSPHSFRATAITSFITAGGSLERARVLANHSSAETTRIYDKKQRELTADESILLEDALEPSPHN